MKLATEAWTEVAVAAKDNRQEKVFGFRAFLQGKYPPGGSMAGAFRDNIREFLSQCATAESNSTEGMPSWKTLLVDEVTGVAAPLFTVEDDVQRSSKPFCDFCRSTGWSHHLVSKRRYHFIIPADDEWDGAGLPANSLHIPTARHLLHGIIHCNGFGHLLCITGRHGGSAILSGHSLMDLWDRLCSSLRTREVTVEDVSEKQSVDLRLLLGVAHGVTWFGRWGYRFRMGSFGVTNDLFHHSLSLLSSLDLDAAICRAGCRNNRDLRTVVSTYRSLHQFDPEHCGNRSKLSTAGELLRYMLDVKRRRSPPSQLQNSPSSPRSPVIRSYSKRKRKKENITDFAVCAAELGSRWPVRRLISTAQVVVKELVGHGKMTRQELREQVRATIGDTGLLDFVLKSIAGYAVDGYLVSRRRNFKTRILEFTLEELSSPPDAGAAAAAAADYVSTLRSTEWPSPAKVEKDIVMVYKAVVNADPAAARTVLQGKQWGKTWDLRDDEDDLMRFYVSWPTANSERTPPPPEVVVVAPHASIGELRAEAQRAFRDTYCAMENVCVMRLLGVKGEDWEPVLLGGAESGSLLTAVAVNGEMTAARFEGGEEAWLVGCACGARDDDGERMVACDMCDVWHHTKCVGIDDGQAVPPVFLCADCGRVLIMLRKNMSPLLLV